MTDQTFLIPTRVRLALLADAPEALRLHWARHLMDADSALTQGFLEALNSPDIDVHVDQAETDPAEIVVRASGQTETGVGWRDLNILLLDPWWSDNARSSEMLAAAIVDRWRELQDLAKLPEPSAPVTIVTAIRPHGDNLSIVSVEGREVVANRKEDGSFRWSRGETVIYVPEGMIVPEDVLQARGYWGDAGHESRGLLFKVEDHAGITSVVRGDAVIATRIGDDVSDFLGLVPHQA